MGPLCEHMFDMKTAKVVTLAEASGAAPPDGPPSREPRAIAPSPESPAPRSEVAEAIRASDEADLEDALHQFHGIQCLAHMQLLRVVAEKELRGRLDRDGVRTGAEWLTLKLGLTRKAAREWTQVARALDDLPLIADAYERGQICWDSVRYLVRFATRETEADVLAWAREVASDQVRLAARRHDTSRKVGHAEYAERYVHIGRGSGNAPWRISGVLTAEQGPTVKAALELLAEEPQKTEHDNRSWCQRLADALTEMAGAHLADHHDADRATVVLHVDLETLQKGEGAADFEDGTPVPAEVARRISCDSRLQICIDDANGRSIGLGRTHRSPNASLLRALKRRDKGCRFPGCGRNRFLKSHHIQHWIKDGLTDPDNLVLLCSFHHRLLHEGGWSIRGNPEERIRFVRPDGRKVMMGPMELRPVYRERLFRNSGPLVPVW